MVTTPTIERVEADVETDDRATKSSVARAFLDAGIMLTDAIEPDVLERITREAEANDISTSDALGIYIRAGIREGERRLKRNDAMAHGLAAALGDLADGIEVSGGGIR